MIRNQNELNRLTADVRDVWIANFPVSKQNSLMLYQQQSIKNLTIGSNALNGVSVLELIEMGALERLVIMRGGLSGGTGRLRVTKCVNLRIIDIGDYVFMNNRYLEIANLPQLQVVKIGNESFKKIQSILIESK